MSLLIKAEGSRGALSYRHPPSILYSRVAEQSVVKNFGKEGRNPGLPFPIEHTVLAVLRALIYFSSF